MKPLCSRFLSFLRTLDRKPTCTRPRVDVRKRLVAVCGVCVVSSAIGAAQTFTVLVNFGGTNGANPMYESLVQGRDGNLWGTTAYGGANQSCPHTNHGCGTVFKMAPDGKLRPVFSFNWPTPGARPLAGLTLGIDGEFYGATAQDKGNLFRLTDGGVLTVVGSFNGNNGKTPVGALTQATDGNFYGTTYAGGGADNLGTVFRITPDGTLTTLYRFDTIHGADPYDQLVQSSNGLFYGTTALGGSSDLGTVFKIAPSGVLSVLHSFSGGSEGSQPVGGLVQGQNGDFYGTTGSGGALGLGTVFSITPNGVLTTLYTFGTHPGDGGQPYGPLILATDGNFYGMTSYGTIFQMTPGGALTTLHTFSGTDGRLPQGGLVQHTNGIFYGLTPQGGTKDKGVIFSLDMGVAPFVALVRNSGKTGSPAEILGGGLTATSSVTFNGVSASFTVVSDTYLTATVPGDATTGVVEVTTPSGTLTSNRQFRVTP